MKRATSTILALAASAIGLAVTPAAAQNPAYAPGDLVLCFQQAGGGKTVYANLGNAATGFRGAAAGAADGVNRIGFLNINAELKSAFGDGWATDPTVYAGLAGVWGTSTTDKVTLQDGDPNRTLYISRSRNSTGTVGLASSNLWDLGLAGNTAMSSAASGIEAQNNVLATSFTTAVAVADTSTSQIDDQNPFLAPGIQGPAMGGALEGGIQQPGSSTPFGSFGAAGTVQFALDLYRVLAVNTAPGQVAGDVRMGSYEGTVTIDSGGAVSFVAQLTTPAAEIDVDQPAGTGLTDGDATRDFGSVAVGTTGSALTFVIKNNGDADLTGLAITTDGDQAADFLVSAPADTTLAPGLSTNFTVAFKPSTYGICNAAIHIASSDANENPFDIQLTGTGFVLSPEIAVTNALDVDLQDGIANPNFGIVTVGKTSNSQIFHVKNTGTADLRGLALVKDGANASDFILTRLTSNTLAPGTSASFSVTFKPGAKGFRKSVIHIKSNDADENPFDIKLTGTAILPVPEINIQQPAGSSLLDGKSRRSLGTATVGSTGGSKIFTIKNAGTADLTGIAFAKTGANASDFIVTAPSGTLLSPGAAITFKVEFKPSGGGIRNATLHIRSNDANENPFDIDLTGHGVVH